MKETPKRRDNWAFHMARSDLERRFTAALQSGNRLQGTLGRWTDSGDFFVWADSVIQRLLTESQAITTTRPHVRLTRLAATLGARIRFERMLVSGLNGLLRFGENENRFPRALLRREGEAGWLINVRDSDQRSARESVAHELGHILLYRTASGIDETAWRTTKWSQAEETICNYFARLILMPRELVSPELTTYDNAAEAILFGIAGRLNVSLSFAALRWLDLNSELHDRVAVALWRQYHPFDRYFLLSSLKHLPDSAALVGRVQVVVASIRGRLSFSHALNFWRAVAGAPDDAAQLTLQSIDGTNPAIKAVRKLFADRAVDSEEIDLLCDPRNPRYYRPEWLLGGPEDGFVPLRRGGARRSSVVAELGMETSNKDVREEKVEMGALRGNFRVHAVAHGSASVGKRFVLTAFVPSCADSALYAPAGTQRAGGRHGEIIL